MVTRPELNSGIAAEALAVYRSFTDIPYAKQIAAQANALTSFQNHYATKEEAYRVIRDLSPFFELRFKSVTNLIRKRGTNEILEIAAGLSTRGLLLTDDPNVTYIETDLRKQIETKRRYVQNLLANSNSNRQNLRLAAVDAVNYEELVEVANNLKGPITVVCEGLLLGNGIDVQKRISLNIRRLLSTWGGVWITPDFTYMNNISIAPFLAEVGFSHVETYSRRNLVSHLASIDILGLEKEHFAERLSGRMVHCLWA